ncbi:hypothetical protein GCM10007417_10960 [Glycocaulis alkaliphilus]|nr:hypothetical protein GCM10007417_10960 [Glycocaulis alkaliphilus]
MQQAWRDVRELFLVAIPATLFSAEAVADILRFGLSASTLLLAALILKLSMVPVMIENRLVTEIRRLELRIERMRAES